MRRYELVTAVTDGHRIEGRRGLVLAFFGNFRAFFTRVTDGHSGHSGHSFSGGWVNDEAECNAYGCVYDGSRDDENCTPEATAGNECTWYD